jgi:hypothetical protein
VPHQTRAVRMALPMNVDNIDQLLGAHGDWARYNGYTWLYWTQLSADEVYNVLRVYLTTDDSILVARVDPREYQGWAPPFIWTWLADKKMRIERGE